MKVGRFMGRQILAIVLFLVGIAWIPAAWNGLRAERWFSGDARLQGKMANGVEFWMREGLGREDFTTGSSLFDGEWLYGTYVMAAMGYGQMAVQQPEHRTHYLALMKESIAEVLSDRVRQFDAERWKSDPLSTLETQEGHAAYLGYLNLAISFHRLLDPASPFAALNDEISDALRRRIEASPTLLIETYPYETYPVDNCAAIASVALHSRVTARVEDDLPQRWAERCRKSFLDADTGLMIQAMDQISGKRYDAPRGSGTTLALYFLSFMDMKLSAELYRAVKHELAGNVLGFGLVREYPRSMPGGKGDIDSGAVIFGYGLSPTGFCLGGARLHGDADYFKALYATANAAGAPRETKQRFNFVTGASLGDAILFAMLTAQPGGIEEIIP